MTITINGTTGIAGVDGSASTPAVQGTDTNTGIFFGTDTVTVATGGTTAVTVDSGQRTKFPTTIGVGNATPSTSGSGITFPATASASSDANTLDDYEEGTWTPTVAGAATAGTTTYTTQRGFYTKIGRAVTVVFKVSYSAATGTGGLNIGGNPFTPSSLGNSAEYLGSVMTSNLNLPNAGWATLYFNGGQSLMDLYSSTDDGSLTQVTLSNESADIWGEITYFV